MTAFKEITIDYDPSTLLCPSKERWAVNSDGHGLFYWVEKENRWEQTRSPDQFCACSPQDMCRQFRRDHFPKFYMTSNSGWE